MDLFRQLYPRTPVLWLDAGGFAGDATDAGRLQTEALLDGMSRLGYAAANVSGRELALGVEGFRGLAAAAPFPVLSANIVHQDDGTPVFRPWTVRTLEPGQWPGGTALRIGILGVTAEDPAFLGRTAEGRKVVIGSPERAVSRALPSVRQQADLIILLARLPRVAVQRIVDQMEGIDLVLAGDGGDVTAVQGVPPAATMVFGGDQGKRLGEVRLFVVKGKLRQLTTSLPFLDRRYPFDPALKELEDAANLLVNELYRSRALGTPSVAPESLPAERRFAGSDACAGCHPEVARGWAESGHARAMETLLEAGQEYNPLCVPCHVTGYGEPGAFENLRATPRLANVQCEACHGPAEAHAEDPTAGLTANRDASGCLTCHTTENSPDFEPSLYWEKIRH